MKTSKNNIAAILGLILGLLSVGSIQAIAEEAGTERALMVRVQQISPERLPSIGMDAASSSVRMTIGLPDRKLTSNLWLYHGFAPRSELARQKGCNQLLIAFEGGRISDLYFANAKALEVIQRRIAAGSLANRRVLATVSTASATEVASK